MTYGERLDFAMKMRHMKAIRLAELCGVHRSQISCYLNDRYVPKYPTTEAIASALDVNPDWLIGISDIMEAHGYSNADERLASIPIYESRESGKPIDFIGLPRRMLRFGKRHFGMLAKDDSMNNAGVSERDLMIFEVTDDIQSGDIVCYENDLVRRYVLGSDGTKWLMPANDNFSPVMISAASPLRAYGRLVMIIKIV